MKRNIFLYALLMSVFLYSCNSGGEGGGGSPPTYNLDGTWNVTESSGENTCGYAGMAYSYVATIVHVPEVTA